VGVMDGESGDDGTDEFTCIDIFSSRTHLHYVPANAFILYEVHSRQLKTRLF